MNERRQQRRNRNKNPNNSDDEKLVNESETEAASNSSDKPRQKRRGVSKLISNLAQSAISETQYDNQAFDPDPVDTPDSIQSVLANKHRDKSREVATRIPDNDLNEVIDELHVVREKIKEKIKNNISNELDKVKDKQETEESSEKSDLKLDLSLSTAEHTRPSNVSGRVDSSVRELSLQRIKRIQVL